MPGYCCYIDRVVILGALFFLALKFNLLFFCFFVIFCFFHFVKEFLRMTKFTNDYEHCKNSYNQYFSCGFKG